MARPGAGSYLSPGFDDRGSQIAALVLRLGPTRAGSRYRVLEILRLAGKAGLFRLLSPAGLALLVGLLAAPGMARAAGDEDADPDALAFGLGYFDIVKRRDTAGIFNLEYRSDKKLWVFKPQVGLFGTSEGGFYAYAGIRLDVYFGNRFVFTPSFSPGLYYEGNGRDLHFPVEFRSSAEVAYRFDDYSRLSLGIAHLSNASLGDKNPGVETLTLSYSVPFDKLFGK